MDSEQIQRGIDFNNRAIGVTLENTLNKALSWWRGGKLNKITLVFLAALFVINLFITYPIFFRDLTDAYSATALRNVAWVLSKISFLPQSAIYTFFTWIAITFAPTSYYLFVRKTVLRHEIVAFIATLFFILPNPLSGNMPPLIQAILSGDAGHVFAFAFIPLFLLYVQAFIASGVPILGFLSTVGTAIIAVISPFAMFNLLILYSVVTVAEGFMGSLRIKLMRLGFLMSFSIGLSFFWYYPNVLARIFVLSHVKVALEKFWSVLPLAIPAIPVLGALFFLVFDRRDKLKPIFLGTALLLIYLALFSVSKDLQVSGIFTADRYLLEIAFSASYLIAMIVTLFGGTFIRRLTKKISTATGQYSLMFGSLLVVALLVFVWSMTLRGVHENIASDPITSDIYKGIGNMERPFSITDITSYLATILSIGSFVILVKLLRKFPSGVTKRQGSTQLRR